MEPTLRQSVQLWTAVCYCYSLKRPFAAVPCDTLWPRRKVQSLQSNLRVIFRTDAGGWGDWADEWTSCASVRQGSRPVWPRLASDGVFGRRPARVQRRLMGTGKHTIFFWILYRTYSYRRPMHCNSVVIFMTAIHKIGTKTLILSAWKSIWCGTTYTEWSSLSLFFALTHNDWKWYKWW